MHPSSRLTSPLTQKKARSVSVFALLAPIAAVSALMACGSDKASPADVNVLKLKTPLALTATPLTGKVQLSWFGNNNEEDFSGYNIYVSTAAQEDIVKAFGLTQDKRDPQLYTPIQFRDAKDDKIESIRANLSKFFNWDKASGTSKAGDGKVFEPFVRCNVAASDKGGPCQPITEANDENRANGAITFTLDVKPTTGTYAVFVASTQDEGEEIGSPTSGVYFVRPHAVKTLPAGTFNLASSGKLDGVNLLTDTLAITQATFPSTGGFCLPAETTAAAKSVSVYFETLKSGDIVLTGANGTRIADLGVPVDKDAKPIAGNAFESTTRSDAQVLLPAVGSATDGQVKPDPTTVPTAGDLGTRGGYSRCGQSRRALAGHLYSIAVPDGGQWRYVLLAAPATGLDKIENYKVIVGAPGERRL